MIVQLRERRIYVVDIDDCKQVGAAAIKRTLDGMGWSILNRNVDQGQRIVLFLCERRGPTVEMEEVEPGVFETELPAFDCAGEVRTPRGRTLLELDEDVADEP